MTTFSDPTELPQDYPLRPSVSYPEVGVIYRKKKEILDNSQDPWEHYKTNSLQEEEFFVNFSS